MTNVLLSDETKQEIIDKITQIQKAYPFVVRTERPNFVTNEDITTIETKLNVKLPNDYIWFLKTFGEISVLTSDYGFPFHIDGVATKNGQKHFSVIDNTLKFRNEPDDDFVSEYEYDLQSILSVDTSEEDFQKLLAVNTNCILDIEYYCEVDCYNFFGQRLKSHVDEIYNDLFDENGQPTSMQIQFEAIDDDKRTHTHIVLCNSNTSFDYSYSENSEIKYYENESSLVNLLKQVVINDNAFGLQACQNLYKQVIDLENITAFSVSIADVEETFNVQLPKYETVSLREHGDIVNGLDKNCQLGVKINDNFIVYDCLYDCHNILYITLFMQTHKGLSAELIIIGALQNNKAYLAYSKSDKSLYMLVDNQATKTAKNLQDFVSKLQSDITISDNITDSRTLAFEASKTTALTVQYETSLVKNGFFGNYPDCMYSVERLNNIWLVFFSERGHVFNATAFSHSKYVIDFLRDNY